MVSCHHGSYYGMCDDEQTIVLKDTAGGDEITYVRQ